LLFRDQDKEAAVKAMILANQTHVAHAVGPVLMAGLSSNRRGKPFQVGGENASAVIIPFSAVESRLDPQGVGGKG
jgi:hypothetical protein